MKILFFTGLTIVVALIVVFFLAVHHAPDSKVDPKAEVLQEQQWQKAAKEVGEAVEAVEKACQVSWNNAKKRFEAIWNSTKKDSQDLLSDAKKSGENAAKSTKKQSLTFWQRTKKSISEAYQRVQSQIDKLFSNKQETPEKGRPPKG